MAITKRGRISFDFKIVFAGDEFEEFTENLVALTKKVSLGEKITGLELAMVKAALVGGPEAAAEIAIKSGAQSFIRKEFTESGLTVGNVAVML